MYGWIPGIIVRGIALGAGTTLGTIAGLLPTGIIVGAGDGATIPTTPGVGAGAGATHGIIITTTVTPRGAALIPAIMLAISVLAVAM